MFITLCRSCGTPAAAVLSFNYDDSQAWLDDIATSNDQGPVVALCTAHADSRTVPVGWELLDRRRSSDRHLFIPTATPGEAANAGAEAANTGVEAAISGVDVA